MTFIGNDVVALNDFFNMRSFSNPRYLKKVMTSSELSFIISANSPWFLPHLYWSCKESVYKAAIKSGYNQPFIPMYFDAQIHDIVFFNHGDTYANCSGTVKHDGLLHFFSSNITKGYITTIACSEYEPLADIYTAIGCADAPYQSFIARTHLGEELSGRWKQKKSEVFIGKNEKGIPFAISLKTNEGADISFSHDGPFYSYAFLLQANNKCI